jgi:hypothetical protein
MTRLSGQQQRTRGVECAPGVYGSRGVVGADAPTRTVRRAQRPTNSKPSSLRFAQRNQCRIGPLTEQTKPTASPASMHPGVDLVPWTRSATTAPWVRRVGDEALPRSCYPPCPSVERRPDPRHGPRQPRLVDRPPPPPCRCRDDQLNSPTLPSRTSQPLDECNESRAEAGQQSERQNEEDYVVRAAGSHEHRSEHNSRCQAYEEANEERSLRHQLLLPEPREA